MNNAKRIEEILERDGIFVSTTSGVSMYPMLRDRKDTIIVEPYEGRLKKFDVPLYRRGERYVLHRIVEVRDDSYVIRGDNCEQKEYGITDQDILGVLTGFYRGDKKVDMNGVGYRFYVNFYCRMYVLQWLWRRSRGVVRKIGRIFRKEE